MLGEADSGAPKLTILQVSEFYPPVIGGLERIVSGLATELARRGHTVAVAVPTPGASEVVEQDGVTVHHLRGWAGPVLRRLSTDSARVFHPTAPDPGLVLALDRLVDELRPDIIHVHGWVAYSALAARRPPGSRLVATLHDHSLVCANRTYLNHGHVCTGPALPKCVACNVVALGAAKSAGLAVGLRASRPLHRRLNGVIAVSRAVADTAGPALRGSGAEVRVIPNFVDLRPPAAPDGEIAGMGLPAEGFALFVGSLGHHKGLDALLDAHRIGLGLPLVLAGVPTTTTPATWPSGVTVLQNLPHPVVMALWQRCRVAVVPSVWLEPFGLVALEAMLSGVPVVASDVGGLPEVVEAGVTGILVAPGDAAALAGAVRSLAEDRELARAMGERGVLRAQRFGVAPVVDRIEAFYRDLLGRPLAAGAAGPQRRRDDRSARRRRRS